MVNFTPHLNEIAVKEPDKLAALKFKTAGENLLYKAAFVLFLEKGDAFFEKLEREVYPDQIGKDFQD
jgi:hypothetical protein